MHGPQIFSLPVMNLWKSEIAYRKVRSALIENLSMFLFYTILFGRNVLTAIKSLHVLTTDIKVD